jgi:hypothetical protein
MIKAGDTVECIHDLGSNGEIQAGHLYTVKEVKQINGDCRLFLEGVMHTIFISGCNATRFKLQAIPTKPIAAKPKRTRSGECPCRIGLVYGQCDYHPVGE